MTNSCVVAAALYISLQLLGFKLFTPEFFLHATGNESAIRIHHNCMRKMFFSLLDMMFMFGSKALLRCLLMYFDASNTEAHSMFSFFNFVKGKKFSVCT